MYSVSDEYKSAIRAAGVTTSARGVCGSVSFDDSNILEGSFSITNQCSGSDQVAIGQVYIAELDITLRGLSLDKYSYRGLEIIPYFVLTLEDDTEEEVPLGQYTISDAKWTSAGVVIKAYDHMAKLDKTCSITTTAGTPYVLALLACEECDLTLDTTQSEFTAFANGSQTLTLYSEENDISTWRDFISWVAQSCACNVFANRDGNIEFRPYSSTAVDTIDTYHRFRGASFSDFETYYTGIYLTLSADNSMNYYSMDTDDGLTYKLGENPFFQYGTADALETYCINVLTAMQEICYVPFGVDLIDDPSYDLMDVVVFEDGLGDSDKLYCITKFTWTYHDKLEIEGTGSDPSLATAQSKTEKSLIGLVSKIDEDAMQFYSFTNAEDITVSDGETVEILNLDYITKKDAHVDFRAELKMVSDTTETLVDDTYYENDTVGTFTYILNDLEVALHPDATYVDGDTLEQLIYWWYSSKNVSGTFIVNLTANGGDIIIPAGCLNAMMYGEGLVGEDEETEPEFSDTIDGITFIGMLGTFTDEATVETQTPEAATGSESVSAIAFSGMFSTFTDTLSTSFGMVFTPYLSTEHFVACTVPDDGTTWTADASDEYIQTVDLYGVESFTAETGGALSYQISIDSGTTWGSWDGSTLTEGDEMTYSTISAITSWPSPVMIKILFDNTETLSSFTAEGGSVST